MFCSKCGNIMNDDLFCNTCGAKRLEPMNTMPPSNPGGPVSSVNPMPEAARPAAQLGGTVYAVNPAPVMPKTGKKTSLPIMIGAAVLIVVIIVLSALLILKPGNTASSSMLTITEENFAKPDDAVEHFITAVANNDLKAALSACAVNELAQKFDAAAYINRMKAIPYMMAAPSEYEFYAALNQAWFLGQITSQIKTFTYSLLDSEAANALAQSSVVQAQDDTESIAAAFVEDTDPAALKTLKIIRVDLPVPDIYNSEINQKNIKKMAAMYGTDEVTDRIMLVELNGTQYLVGFTLLKYDESWKILGMSSGIAGTSGNGAATEISESDYLALT